MIQFYKNMRNLGCSLKSLCKNGKAIEGTILVEDSFLANVEFNAPGIGGILNMVFRKLGQEINDEVKEAIANM